MNVRDATVEDAEAIRTVHIESIEGLGTDGYTQRQVEAWAAGCRESDYEAAIDGTDTEFVVADANGSIVGFGSLTLESPEEYEAAVDAEISAVYVRPSVAREGVGSALLAELEDRARAADVATVGLRSSLNAVPFYERLGYERVRERSHEFSGHLSTGVTGTVVEMITDL